MEDRLAIPAFRRSCRRLERSASIVCASGCSACCGRGALAPWRRCETSNVPDDARGRVGASLCDESRAARDVEKDCYLVDPASSHMLVSKIKPCMCKYEQIQTVKLRMAH